MQAPLGEIARKLLLKKETSRALMKRLIVGSRFDLDEPIMLDDRKIKIERLSAINVKKNKDT